MPESDLTRRRFLGAAVATGAAAVPAGQAHAAPARTRRRRRARHADVVVVGAGFAGLTAARQSSRQAGHSVVVLEARDRVGGRALNHSIGNGKVAEAAATFVGPTQDHIAGLAKRDGGRHLRHLRRRRQRLLRNGIRRYSTATRARSARRRPTRWPADVMAVVEELDLMASRDRRRRALERRPRPATGTRRRSRPGSTPTGDHALHEALAAAAMRPSSGPSRASCRSCSRSSTSPPPGTRRIRAPSSATSTPAAARSRTASWAARS